MAFILGSDIARIQTPEDFGRYEQKWREYRDYLESIRDRVPRSTFEFATASWHYSADPRALHDSCLNSLVISETAREEGHGGLLDMQVRLLGPDHDGTTTLKYHEVYSYSLDTPFEFLSPPKVGHGDWLYDEVRLSNRGHVLHEIEFSRGSRWIIECKDIECIWTPLLS